MFSKKKKYIHWKSNHSHAVKLGVLKGLIHRAHLLCDLKEDLLDELNLLRDVFISNGYPCKLVQRTMNESWSTELKKSIMEEFEESEENHDFLMSYMPLMCKVSQRDCRKS